MLAGFNWVLGWGQQTEYFQALIPDWEMPAI